MKLTLRLPRSIHAAALTDLQRPHAFAAERIGFFSSSILPGTDADLIVAVTDYEPVPDDDYVDDPRSGARINSRAIRARLQRALDRKCGQLHVHLHEHRGPTFPSAMDQRELPRLIQSFMVASPQQVHGGVILSLDSLHPTLWAPGRSAPIADVRVTIVGFPFQFLQ